MTDIPAIARSAAHRLVAYSPWARFAATLIKTRRLGAALERFYLARLCHLPFENNARAYNSYRQYVEHQRSKYSAAKSWLHLSFEARRYAFIEGFKPWTEFVGPILCLGARDGAEVSALRELGKLAIGIDLAYPEKSEFVLYGDFNKIPFPKQTFQTVYTNAFDHIFKPEMILDEVRRVLAPKCYMIVDLSPGSPGAYESYQWKTIGEMFAIFRSLDWIVVRNEPLQNGRERVVMRYEHH